MSVVCSVCGKEIIREDLGCPFCRRKNEWEKLKHTAPNFIFNQLPLGFQKTLAKHYSSDSKNFHSIDMLIKKMYNKEDDYYQSLFLYGDTGEGKTSFACALTLEMLRRSFIDTACYSEYRPLYTLYDFFCALKNTYSKLGPASDTEKTILEKLETVPILIVDDLGIEKGTEWEMYMLYGLVNNRCRELRTTIYTSNYSLDELADKLQNDRIVSRIVSSSVVMKYARKY